MFGLHSKYRVPKRFEAFSSFFFSFLIPEGIFFSDQGRSISIFQAIRYRVSEKHEKRKEREREGKKRRKTYK